MASEEPKAPESGRWQFSLRTLLLGVAALAILLVAGRHFYDWYFSTPLVDAVTSFNARASSDFVGKYEPPITEDEIVSSIEAQLPNLDANDQVKAIYSRIAHTGRLPPGASLNSIPGYSPASGTPVTFVWWINLEIMTGKKSGYGLRIRETNNPKVAAQKSQSAPP